MSPNAFIACAAAPTDDQLTTELGAVRAVWDELLTALDLPIQEWNSYSLKAGWSLKLKLGKRTILYLSPLHGAFRVAFILGPKAVAAAPDANLSKSLLKLIDEAPRYPEGTGVRLEIKSRKDLPAVKKLAALKLAH